MRKIKPCALRLEMEGLSRQVVAAIAGNLAAILQKDQVGGIDLPPGESQIGVKAPVRLAVDVTALHGNMAAPAQIVHLAARVRFEIYRARHWQILAHRLKHI